MLYIILGYGIIVCTLWILLREYIKSKVGEKEAYSLYGELQTATMAIFWIYFVPKLLYYKIKYILQNKKRL